MYVRRLVLCMFVRVSVQICMHVCTSLVLVCMNLGMYVATVVCMFVPNCMYVCTYSTKRMFVPTPLSICLCLLHYVYVCTYSTKCMFVPTPLSVCLYVGTMTLHM